jgi:hypothetical protein
MAIGFAWAIWTGRVRPRAWIVIAGLQAVLLGAGLFAMNTGEHEEDRVEAVVPDGALHRHEEYAEQFVWAAGITLVFAGLVLVARQRPVPKGLIVATVAGSVIVAAAGVRVGRAGGELVYVHNAGAAYGRLASVASKNGGTDQKTERARTEHDR